MIRNPWAVRAVCATALILSSILAAPRTARAQDEAPVMAELDTTALKQGKMAYANTFAGAFTPAGGFDLIKTERGTLNISGYGLWRWLDQMPAEQTFTDHLGRERTVKARNDLNWHRTFVWVSGYFYDPKFRYNLTIWGLGTTQQSLIFGNMQYRFGVPLTLGVGVGPNLTSRSTQGTWPFWAASDRQMGEEFFRGGFSSSFFIAGEPVKRLFYSASVNTNLSQLGVTATNDTRDMSYSGSVYWMPTTGEFGPRAGFGDLEYHQVLSTRFGLSGCTVREGRGAPVGQPNNETQIRLSDGVYAFEAGALADTVTVTNLDYHYLSADAGAKYRGFCFQGEVYYRTLSHFAATGPLPLNSIKDTGFMAEAMQMVVPKTLGLYVATGYVWDDFKRHPWELSGGASFYPFQSRSWRLNLHYIHVEKCPTGSNFGYYTAGQTGNTVSLGTDVIL
jgi:hypothetical protein